MQYFLLVDGVIFKNNTIRLGKWYKTGPGTVEEIIPGDYLIQILDSEGKALIEISFYTSFEVYIDPIEIIKTDFAGFTFAIPLPENAATVKILYKKEIIIEVNLTQKLFNDAINSLIPNYNALIRAVEESDIQLGVKNSLLSKLNNAKMKTGQALTYIENKRYTEAKNMLNSASNIIQAFINEVNAQTEKKILKELANEVINWAQKMILDLQNQVIESLR